MARSDPYGPVVEARRQTAERILCMRALLQLWIECGGLEADLKAIRDAGAKAALAHTGQSEAAAGGKAATLEIIGTLDELKAEYGRIMAVVQAVRGDLVRGSAAPSVVAAVETILRNEVSVHYTQAGLDAASRRAAKLQTQEALRAEIRKDGQALLDLPEVAAPLAARRVSAERLQAMVTSADGLSGRLGERRLKKGAAKAATQAEQEAVREQKAVWGPCYRLLLQVAAQDARVKELLAAASRKAR